MEHITLALDVGTPELLVDRPSGNGEGPLWHEDSETLTWLDIPAGQVLRFDPEQSTNTQIYQHKGEIGGHTIQEDGSLVLFCTDGAILRLIGDDTETIIESVDVMVGSRFNDVITDPEGRVFAGTMPLKNHPARLYRLDPDGSLTCVIDDLTLANGMGFSPDLSTFYVTDSNSRQIYQMPYDRASGELGERKVFLALGDHDRGVPDGMAVDTQGNVWSARWDGHGIFKYSPEGALLGKVEFPVSKTSSLTFGGPDLGLAFVTSAGGKDRGPVEGPLAGSLFGINLGVKGRAPFRSRIGM